MANAGRIQAILVSWHSTCNLLLQGWSFSSTGQCFSPKGALATRRNSRCNLQSHRGWRHRQPQHRASPRTNCSWQIGRQPTEIRTVGTATDVGHALGQQALEILEASPAVFVENQGQWRDASVHYAAVRIGSQCATQDRVRGLSCSSATPRRIGRNAMGRRDGEPSRGGRLLPGRARRRFLRRGPRRPASRARPSRDDVQLLPGRPVKLADRRTGIRDRGLPGTVRWHHLLTWGQRGSLKYEFHVDAGADIGRFV